jgi:hypothetical protein
VLDDILVPHELLKGRKTIIVPRQVMSKENFLVAMDVNKGQLDAYSGIEIDAKGEVVKYIRGAVQLKDKSTQARLRYNVDFLQSPNSEVSYSAHLELRRAVTTSYADLRKVAETLKPEPLLKALADDKTPAEQRGTFGMLLGHCGKKEDAAVLRKLIDASWGERFRQVDATDMLFGYAVLDPEAGWSLLMTCAEQKDKHFMHRYAVLQTVRRLGANRPDLVDAKKLTAGTARFFNTPDMADFAIEDLRKLKHWEYCDAILDLPANAGFDTPIIRRSVLRFALQCPSPTAKTFVQIERNLDADRVTEAEELLALEKEEVGPRKK